MPDPEAQWLRDAMQHGLSCAYVERHRNLGRNGKFEDALVKSRLRLTRHSLSLQSGGLSVQLKELKCIEGHRERPGSPVFRTADKDVVPRLITLRWNQTGRQLQTGQYAHLIFSTRSDARAFSAGMNQVRQFGAGAVLAGRCREDGALAEPTAWQIERGRECFAGARKSRIVAHLREALQALLAPGAALPPGREADIDTARPSQLSAPWLWDDADMHMRWLEGLGGRPVSELTPEELRPLVAEGMPLKYRLSVWSSWISKPGADQVESLHQNAPDDLSRQIELDLPRTRSEWLTDHQRNLLRRVLNAYAARNAVIGYCQGMNFLAMVFVVLGFPEADVFAGLCYIVEDLLPGCHGRSLEGYVRDASVLDVLVHHLLPAVHQQLDAADVSLNMLALDHFLSLMAGKWPFAPVVRLWDFLLLEGSPAIFASFVALLELYFPKPSETAGAEASADCTSPADTMDAFREACLRGVMEDMDTVHLHARNWLELIPQSLVDRLREEIVSEEEPAGLASDRTP